MKHVRNLFILSLSTAIFFASCKKADVLPAAPTVDVREVGNDKNEAYAGSDLHVDADVVANGVLENIKVQITPAATGAGWTFTKTYADDFAGKKNADFHVHIDIPEDAAPGDYKIVITATDKNGKATSGSGTFKIIKDASIPGMDGMTLTLSTNKNELTLNGIVKAPNKLSKVEVEIKSASWSKTYVVNDAAMVGQLSYELNKTFDISAAPAGHYHITIKITDQFQKMRDFPNHFDK